MASYRTISVQARVTGDRVDNQAIILAIRAALKSVGLAQVAIGVAPWHPRGCDCPRCPNCRECGGNLNGAGSDWCDCSPAAAEQEPPAGT